VHSRHSTSGLNYQPFIEILKPLRELQLKHGFLEHADYISSLIDMAQLASPEFVNELSSGNMWGSAGSMVDLVFIGNVEGSEKELLADEAEYARLLLQLAEEMVAQGIMYERAQSLMGMLKKTAHVESDGSPPSPH